MNNGDEVLNKTQHIEMTYTIVPNKVKAEDLFAYITHELSFDKVLSLYILLRTAISTGKLGD